MADTGDGERVATPPAYALQRSGAEIQRLALQERVIGSSTARFFEEAGIEAGMRVLDVGSGAGDVAMGIARRVGSSGSVLGVDIDGPSVEIATGRAAAGGYANVAFVKADVVTADLGSDFDAAVGRLVLMHVQDPALVLGRVAGLVRPTGVVAFQEANLASPWLSYPISASLERVQRVRTLALLGGQPVHPYMGLALRETYLRAGLADPKLRTDVVGGGQDWAGYELVEQTVRSLLPGWRNHAVSGVEDIHPDGLAARLRDEIGDQGSIMLYPLFGAATRLQR